MFRFLTLLALIAFCAASPAGSRQADEPRRIALVIGNSNYESAPDLEQPVRDAEDVAAALDELGFDLIGGRAHADVTLNDMLDLISAFTDEIGPDDEAVFYFSGHGIGGLQTSYLLPSDDGELDDRSNLPRFAISTDDIVKNIPGQGAGTLVIILDACRDNPLPDDGKSAFLDRGLSKGVGVFPRGDFSLVYLYAAEPGERAYTGDGRNSYFTTALLQSMRTPGSELGTVIREVRNEVRRLTSGRNPQQRPWSEGVTNRPFYFKPPEETICGGLYTTRSAERRWQRLQAIADAKLLRNFAQQCSDTPFSKAALELANNLKVRRSEPPNGYQISEDVREAISAASSGAAIAHRQFRECASCPNMVVIPSGKYVMGAVNGFDNEKPLRTVTISTPIAVGQFEVTWNEWGACVEAGYCDNAPVLAAGGAEGWGLGERPVVNVNYADANDFIYWLNVENGLIVGDSLFFTSIRNERLLPHHHRSRVGIRSAGQY